MDEATKHRVRRLIETRLAEIAAEDAATIEDRQPVALDQQSVGRLSRMDAMQVQAMATAQSRCRAVMRQRLRTALARLGSDDFGYGNDCGEPIAEKRLALDPAHTRCVDCASR
ncbi:MAG: TraR/DksA C4-type zinc finger protein [Pseudomonadota bacterium]